MRPFSRNDEPESGLWDAGGGTQADMLFPRPGRCARRSRSAGFISHEHGRVLETLAERGTCLQHRKRMDTPTANGREGELPRPNANARMRGRKPATDARKAAPTTSALRHASNDMATSCVPKSPAPTAQNATTRNLMTSAGHTATVQVSRQSARNVAHEKHARGRAAPLRHRTQKTLRSAPNFHASQASLRHGGTRAGREERVATNANAMVDTQRGSMGGSRGRPHVRTAGRSLLLGGVGPTRRSAAQNLHESALRSGRACVQTSLADATEPRSCNQRRRKHPIAEPCQANLGHICCV